MPSGVYSLFHSPLCIPGRLEQAELAVRWPDHPSAGLRTWRPQQGYKAALVPPASWHGSGGRRRVWQRQQPIAGGQGPPRQPGTCLPAALPRVLSNFLF